MEKSEKQILIVDDEPNIVVAIEFLLKKEGYQTQTASNGEEALLEMKRHKPDLVILDVMMPGLNGFDTAKSIRDNPEWEDLHIIFLTAKSTPADKAFGYSSGAEIYLTKPFDNEELVTTIQETLEFDI